MSETVIGIVRVLTECGQIPYCWMLVVEVQSSTTGPVALIWALAL